MRGAPQRLWVTALRSRLKFPHACVRVPPVVLRALIVSSERSTFRCGLLAMREVPGNARKRRSTRRWPGASEILRGASGNRTRD